MAKKRINKSKRELLVESREKGLAAQAEHRGSVPLDKVERMLVAGFQSREREIKAMMGPLTADIDEFYGMLNANHGVKIGETHVFNWQACELVPMPPKEAAAPEPDKPQDPPTSQPPAEAPVPEVPAEEPVAAEASPAVN